MQYSCSCSQTVIQTQYVFPSLYNYKNCHEAFTVVVKIDKRQFGNLDILAVVNFAGVTGLCHQIKLRTRGRAGVASSSNAMLASLLA